jgi:hypothetical protein
MLWRYKLVFFSETWKKIGRKKGNNSRVKNPENEAEHQALGIVEGRR